MPVTALHEIPKAADGSVKDVYAFFGFAAYTAQVLEKGLLNLVVAFESKGFRVSQQEFDALFKTHEKKTLGQLLRRSKKATRMRIRDDLMGNLDLALSKRNWLAHQFFLDYSAAFMTNRGRKEMIEALRELIAFFQSTDRAIEAVAGPMLQEAGLTEEKLQER